MLLCMYVCIKSRRIMYNIVELRLNTPLKHYGSFNRYTWEHLTLSNRIEMRFIEGVYCFANADAVVQISIRRRIRGGRGGYGFNIGFAGWNLIVHIVRQVYRGGDVYVCTLSWAYRVYIIGRFYSSNIVKLCFSSVVLVNQGKRIQYMAIVVLWHYIALNFYEMG